MRLRREQQKTALQVVKDLIYQQTPLQQPVRARLSLLLLLQSRSHSRLAP